ncbi:MCE family protein [Mycobacterium sp. OTB74]|uniref:MCE family protein n=1 Tax=Mycobacterium sp. OTB74 TaxID=1853452 RepID=UPI002476FFE7|nr:MCE family protein [Mycobacterium sp. OTB74]
MSRYRGVKMMRAGAIGVVLIILICTIGLTSQSLVNLATTVRYRAQFTDAGGLAVGNDVTRSGVKIGSVSDVAIERGKASVTFVVDARYRLGSETTAHVRTGTLLGQRVLALTSAGGGVLRPGTTIPVSRTSTPYSLSDATGDMTTNTAGTDTQGLNDALDTLSVTMDRIAPELGPTFDGLAKLSRALGDRKGALRSLLTSTARVSSILAQRSDAVATLILDANTLVGVLDERRQAIVNLLVDTTAVAHQLSGLVAENDAKLAPTLDRLNAIIAMLQKNQDNIAKAIPGLAKYELTLGEAVSSGYYYQAYQPNLVPGEPLQPFLDYAFGFRRGTGQGQPPDNAGPRAEFPIPYNGIPPQGGTHQ